MCKSRESASLRWSELTSQWRITRQETFILNIHDCFPSSSFAIETTDPPKLPWINWSKQFSFCAVICVAKNLFITLANLFSVILQWTSQIKSLISKAAIFIFCCYLGFELFTFFVLIKKISESPFKLFSAIHVFMKHNLHVSFNIGLSNLIIMTLWPFFFL